MTAYGDFARFYDILTTDVDYPRRARYIGEVFRRFGKNPELVLDLACGTGGISFELLKMGYDVIGVDRSPQMLSAAAAKNPADGASVMLLCQDMRDLDLYGTVDAAVCCLDSINHLTSPQAVNEVFSKVSLFLNPGGLFVFDVNTEYKFSHTLLNNAFVYDYDDVYCIWQNRYNTKTKLCRFELTFFENCGSYNDNSSYRRFDEQFSERAYSAAQIKNFLKKNGLSLKGIYNELSFDQPKDDCERFVFVAEKGL